ncbi:MAG TPA: hypothetical protein VFP64_13025 [Pyrinomonadaceae bacterium]|nr:hypothetical protein [Pyrinomonadaceae bacterium]
MHHVRFEPRQEVVNGNSASLQTKEREAVVNSLPVSMHTGQIIMLTKMFTAADLNFYDFSADALSSVRFEALRRCSEHFAAVSAY